MDFVFDRTAEGRSVKSLMVVADATRGRCHRPGTGPKRTPGGACPGSDCQTSVACLEDLRCLIEHLGPPIRSQLLIDVVLLRQLGQRSISLNHSLCLRRRNRITEHFVPSNEKGVAFPEQLCHSDTFLISKKESTLCTDRLNRRVGYIDVPSAYATNQVRKHQTRCGQRWGRNKKAETPSS
jgi:hypothetical protein